MGNLFIIGNGFDSSHGLKTSYEDFHTYLKKKYPNATSTDCVPDYIPDWHGDYVPANEDEVIGFIEHLLCEADGDEWNNLEASIGKIDFEDYLQDYDHDDNDDDDLWHEQYFNESCAMALVYPILEIPTYFNKWISSIDVSGTMVKHDFVRLIDKNSDSFLSFNYTSVLEDIYEIRNVCHIHGIQGGKLLFGHGEDYDYYSDENYGMHPGTEESFQRIQDQLRKDTKSALNQNEDFFNGLNSSINQIFSYGFSFSDVDQIYIKEICSKLDTNSVTWFLNGYDNDLNRNRYQTVIRSCGFKGNFDVFNIKN